jgi:hypothetical protein
MLTNLIPLKYYFDIVQSFVDFNVCEPGTGILDSPVMWGCEGD